MLLLISLLLMILQDDVWSFINPSFHISLSNIQKETYIYHYVILKRRNDKILINNMHTWQDLDSTVLPLVIKLVSFNNDVDGDIYENNIKSIDIRRSRYDIGSDNDSGSDDHNSRSHDSYDSNRKRINSINKIDINDITASILKWKKCLMLGYLPEDNDYNNDNDDDGDNNKVSKLQWPIEPLKTKIFDLLHSMNIPSLALRHPELIYDIILSILQLSIDYHEKLQDYIMKKSESKDANDDGNDDQMKSSIDQFIASYYSQDDIDENNDQDNDDDNQDHLSSFVDDMSSSLLRQFHQIWSSPLESIQILDEIYGSSSHNLLISSNKISSSSSSSPSSLSSPSSSGLPSNMLASASLTKLRGYTPYDGIWKHSGWKQCKDINNQLRDMKELKELINNIGYRSNINNDNNKKRKFRLTYYKITSLTNVCKDNLLPIETNNICRSNNLQMLFISEYILLTKNKNIEQQQQQQQQHLQQQEVFNNCNDDYSRSNYFNDDDSSKRNVNNVNKEHTSKEATTIITTNMDDNIYNNNHNNVHQDKLNSSYINYKKKLFFSKWLSNNLLSYERIGYINKPSIYSNKKKYHLLPSTTGGSIIICLDTSYSMSGLREILAKSVVLYTIMTSVKMKRNCKIIAFSGKNKIIDYEIKINKSYLSELLDFLSYSFNGGTDVTSPLTKAIELIDSDILYSDSDIILITDGELQNPPVSWNMLNKIRKLEIDRGN